jgi:glycosyltransferase involved in cell wall biosynthesis
MKIGIDYTAAMWQGAGIGRYTRELIRATLAHGPEFQYVLFFAAGGLNRSSSYVADLQQICRQYPNVRAAPIPLSPRRLTQLWQRLRLPLPVELFTGHLDLLHAPDFVLPPTRARSLVTIHDLSFFVYPQFAAPGMVRYLTSAVPRSVQRANVVLADSEWTRRDLNTYMRVPPERVAVVYPGVDPVFRPMLPVEYAPLRHKLALPDDFLLFVGTLSPRKNIVRLLEALHIIIQRPRWRRLTLALVGKIGWLCDDIFQAIARLELQEHVRLMDFVDDNDLPAVYNLARAGVFPSLYEGFGLPALEALACGSPLVTANNSSLPEVTGDAAVLVDAENVQAIARGIEQALEDDSLRARLRAEGPERAKLFTWERATQQLLAWYRA